MPPLPLAPSEELPADGRVLRRQKTRRAVVDALLELLDEGSLRPTASQVAERAGVSLRSIGQNFGTQEQLFREAAEAVVLRTARTISTPSVREDRIEVLVANRAAFAEATAQVRRAAALISESTVVLATAKSWRKARRAELSSLFAAELSRLAESARRDSLRALEGAVSMVLWDELRFGMRLSRAEAERVMVTTVRALVDQMRRGTAS